MESFNSKVLCTRADALLKSLIPAVQQLCVSDLQLPKDQQNPPIHQFVSTLIRAAELVKFCESISAFNVFRRCSYASQILKLEEEIDGIMNSIPAHVESDARNLMAALKDLYKELKPPDLSRTLNTMIQQQMSLGNLCRSTEMEEANKCSYLSNVPVKSRFYAGLEKPVGDLKELLFQSEVSVVGVHCMGGGGKTTLALAICNDPHIKDYFENVHFITVSQSPNLKVIIETMWEKIVGRKKPEFQNVEDARIQLNQQLFSQSKRILMILDDVWSRAHLEELLIEAPGYKTVITTRDSSIVPQNSSTRLYQLPLLGHEDALSLFCFSAFGQTSIPSNAHANLVMEVQAECKGLPLALKVIGSSLNGEPYVTWSNAKNKLSLGESISSDHEEGLFRCLETSINFLDDVGRECFLDLALFPENKKTCANALLDIWVYVRKLEWQDAFMMLVEFARKSLLNLVSSPGSQATISYGNASELYFSQHDVMRDLAIYLGNQDSIVHRKRLFMPRKELSLPGEWGEMLNDRPFNAQVVSIHTGSMVESQWYKMDFPEAEVLVLHFSASKYFLPPFVKTMKKLKFVMLCNLNSKRATVEGLDALSSLTQLRSVRLEKLEAPTVLEQIKAIQKLDKLSLCLCQGFGNISTFSNTNLQEFNLDHCSDLEEWPAEICCMPSAQVWSITNCHLVEKLPCDLGNLSSLRMLRLSALPALKEFPASIGKLGQLEFLDISVCEGLKELPEEIGQLKQLKEFDMRECSRLRRLPRSVCELSSLKYVICDEKIGHLWLQVKASFIPDLRVEIVEPQFTLDWLDD
ncbi:putative disease resistance protein At5g47280 isoform X1 [Cryptomeria japonica]|uniref:putative disease resistance protein At5g47280 isoform X1 n=1 Tax=Cryptomeria japonica TaxID=3369 RepID=UPI0027DA356F|nr:putative disease resistance protein At5g47280 isoform X1 [Cryptomeria japonica]